MLCVNAAGAAQLEVSAQGLCWSSPAFQHGYSGGGSSDIDLDLAAGAHARLEDGQGLGGGANLANLQPRQEQAAPMQGRANGLIQGPKQYFSYCMPGGASQEPCLPALQCNRRQAGRQAHQGQAGHLGAPLAHGLARGHVKLGAVGGAGDAAAEGEVGASAGGDSR